MGSRPGPQGFDTKLLKQGERERAQEGVYDLNDFKCLSCLDFAG